MGSADTREPRRAFGPLHLVAIGANHRTAPVSVREALLRRVTYRRIAIPRASLPVIEDLALLRTCNRVEVYALSRRAPAAAVAIRRTFAVPRKTGWLYELEDLDAVAHLLRVASGLDSIAVGESQISRQVRGAVTERPGPWDPASGLATLFERAARLAPRLRSLAGVEGEVSSASHAAVRFARGVVGLPTPRITLLGSGKMVRLAVRAIGGDPHVTVVDRDLHKARAVAAELGGRAAPLADIANVLRTTDVLLAATSSKRRVIGRPLVSHVQRLRVRRPLWIIDLGVPRNVDPRASSIEGVRIVTIDDLAPWAGSLPDPASMARAERRIRRAAEALLETIRPPGDSDEVEALRRSAEQIRRIEVDRALARMPHATMADRAVVDKMALRLVNRLLHAPTELARRLQSEGRAGMIAELLPPTPSEGPR
ncbi:MAG TPA: glutamyl-tRNA reductase [Thermoplasmata archaeon]|nr:glutamyl-tRNA reductase [Thermoplasmata archaeon]